MNKTYLDIQFVVFICLPVYGFHIILNIFSLWDMMGKVVQLWYICFPS